MEAKKVSYFLVLIFAVKLLLASFMPVFGDEAYYYIWSLHPQLSYFDHPAMVSWLIALSHSFLPNGNPFSLRFSFVVLSFLSSLLWVKILRLKNYTSEQIFWFLIFCLLNPLLGLGSIVSTPDVPLVFFWSLSFFIFLKLLDQQRLYWYFALGMALGLGFCSKYHIVIFVISGLIYLFLNKKMTTLKPLGVFLTLLSGSIASLPVLIWNSQNNWSSFLFQINHGFGEAAFSWQWPLSYLFAQTLIINPFILYSLFTKVSDSTDKIFSLSQLGFFFTSSLKSVVEGNWPLTSHLHSAAHASLHFEKKQRSYSVVYWIVFYLLLGGFFISSQSAKVRKNLINSSQFSEIYPLVDQYKPLYGPSYQVASLISWKTQKNIPKLAQLSREDFYDSLPDSTPTTKEFFVLKYDYSEWPELYSKYRKTKIQSFDNVGLELYHFKYE